MAMTKLPAAAWETGAWADIAGVLGGPVLRVALVAGGMMSAFGMFNALVMSYSRLPLAMALDGMLPKVFAKLHPKTRAPWVAITVLSIGWACSLGLGFERLVTIDILVYGTSLVLEFLALVVLRIREPNLPRAFRVPGGMFGAVMVGVCPALLLGFSIVRSGQEQILGMSSLAFGLILIAGGVVGYGIKELARHSGLLAPAPGNPEPTT
jgi:amino acid transporter